MNELKIFSNTEFGKLSVNNTDNGIYFFLLERYNQKIII